MFVRFSASTIGGGSGMLLDSNGAPMIASPIGKAETFIDSTPLPSSPASGTYTVLVDPSGVNAGLITVTVYDLGTADPAPAEPREHPRHADGHHVVAGHQRRAHVPGGRRPQGLDQDDRQHVRGRQPAAAEAGRRRSSAWRRPTAPRPASSTRWTCRPPAPTRWSSTRPASSTGSASFTVYDIAADASRHRLAVGRHRLGDRHRDDHDARPERADHVRRHRRPARRRRHLVDHADRRHDVDPAPGGSVLRPAASPRPPSSTAPRSMRPAPTR